MSEPLDDLVSRHARLGRFSGAVLVAKDGRVLLAKGYGHADRERGVENTPETRFEIASLTKQFTAAAILKLEAEGRLGVDDPIARHLPGYPRPQADRITLHHLLTHSSGIPSIGRLGDGLEDVTGDETEISTAVLLDPFQDREPLFEPGTRYRYSNSGYQVLAAIVERVSGMSYDEYLRTALFEPLGMDDTGCDPVAGLAVHYEGYPPDLSPAPSEHPSWSLGDGCASSTVEDLYRWDRALVNGEVLPEPQLRKLFAAHVERGGPDRHYAYGWFLDRRDGRPWIHHGGADRGVVCEMVRLPEEDLTVIVLANRLPRLGVNAPRAIVEQAVALVLGEPVELPPRPAENPSDAARWTGDYALESGGALRVSNDGGRVWIEGLEPRRSVFDDATLASPGALERSAEVGASLVEAAFAGAFDDFAAALCPDLKGELTEDDVRAEWREMFGEASPRETALAESFRYPGETLLAPIFRVELPAATTYLLLELTSAGEVCGWATMSAAELEIRRSLLTPARVPLVELATGDFLADGFNYGEEPARVGFVEGEPARIVVEGRARHEGTRTR